MAIDLYQWLLFAVALLTAMSLPGPGVLATISHALTRGFRPTLFFVFGAAMGDLTFLWIALLGITQIGSSYALLFQLLTLVAAAYFLWLAYSLLNGLVKNSPENADVEVASKGLASKTSRGPAQLLISGYLLTVSNPKVILFYGGLLPSLLAVAAMKTGDLIFISVLTPLSLILVLSTYAFIAGRSRDRFLKSGKFRVLEGFAGLVFLGVGIALIWKAVT